MPQFVAASDINQIQVDSPAKPPPPPKQDIKSGRADQRCTFSTKIEVPDELTVAKLIPIVKVGSLKSSGGHAKANPCTSDTFL